MRQPWGDDLNPILVVRPVGPSLPPNSAKKEAGRVVCLGLEKGVKALRWKRPRGVGTAQREQGAFDLDDD